MLCGFQFDIFNDDVGQSVFLLGDKLVKNVNLPKAHVKANQTRRAAMLTHFGRQWLRHPRGEHP